MTEKRAKFIDRISKSNLEIRERAVLALEPLLAKRLPAWKRVMDIVGSLLGLTLLAPLLLLIAIVIKVVSPGPVFYMQTRIGYLGKAFTLWKFRTMKLDADSLEHQQHLSNLINFEQPMTKLDVNDDPRIIPLGNLLRLSGLDELPQLINVLRGEMSLVGPRPCLPYEAREYRLWQTRRFDAVPGITGLWQVSGKNRTTFKEMMRLDITYARRRSFWLDIKIMLRTIPAIIDQINDGFIEQKARG
ncbi:MAG: sugar transferase [Aliifodinibius sp.]|nr:sugar transferase [Fodinibius sp.]NIV14832.1 sugar transferase [Fodinibius sp.]NIY28711.1 sugar transferase [Fodinibius sp.]